MTEKISNRKKISIETDISKCLKCITQDYSTKTDKLQEPDYVAALCLCLPQKLKNILCASFKNYAFSVTGVFCHQKPFAKFDSKKCEIGDLLFVYFYDDINGNISCNSLLLQAKVLNGKNISLSSLGDKHQFNLYSKWPEFTYSSAGILNGKTRDITPKTYGHGAKYMSINPNSVFDKSNKNIYETAHANNDLCFNSSLSLNLIDLINFEKGEPIDYRPKEISKIDDYSWTKDEWSMLIWDIINITRYSKFNRKNIGLFDFCRNTIADKNLLYYSHCPDDVFESELSKDFLNNNHEYSVITDEYVGLPMMIIESKKLEEKEQKYYQYDKVEILK